MKKILGLSVLSLSTVLAISGCNLALRAEVKDPQDNTQLTAEDFDYIPQAVYENAPDEDICYDLTEEDDYSDLEPMSEEEFENIIGYVVSPSYASSAKSAYPELWEHIRLNCYFNRKEFINLLEFLQEISRVSKEEESPDPYWILNNIAVRVSIDKAYHLMRSLVADEQIFKDLKSFILCMNSGNLNPVNYRAANSYFQEKEQDEPRVAEMAAQEELVWDNFHVNGDDFEQFETYTGFVANDDIRVALKFVSYFVKVLAKYLNKTELGFLFTQMEMLDDKEYANVTAHYVLNNIPQFVDHVGHALKALNVTDTTWGALFNGVRDIMMTANEYLNEEYGRPFVATDNLRLSFNLDQIKQVFDSLNPRGFRIFINFIGKFLCALDRDYLEYVMANMDDPENVDSTQFQNTYLRQYGLLTSEEKTYLDEQLEIFGIDIEKFNTDIDPSQGTGLGPIMDIFQENFMGPINEYFEGIFSDGDPYEEYNRESLYIEPVWAYSNSKLILKKGVEFTEEDVITYLTGRDAPYFRLYYGRECHDSNDRYDTEYRKNFDIDMDAIDTSEVGEGYFIAKFDSEVTFEPYTDDPYDSWENRQYTEKKFTISFELKVYYYVLDDSVEAFVDSFRSDLYEKDQWGSMDDESMVVDSKGNIAVLSYGNQLLVEKNADYDTDRMFASSETYNIGVYMESIKRYIVDDGDSWMGWFEADFSYKDIATINHFENGQYYAYVTLTIKDADSDEEIGTYPAIYVYEVVDNINFQLVDGWYDPGFGY